MIDQKARDRILAERQQKNLNQGLKDAIVSSLKDSIKTGENEEVLKLVVKREDDKHVGDVLDKIAQAIVLLYKKIPSSIVLPKIFPVKGQVEVTKIPSVEVKNLRELEKYFLTLGDRFGKIATAISMIPQSKSDTKPVVIPDSFSIKDFDILLEDLEQVKKGLNILIKKDGGGKDGVQDVNILNFPPTMVPTPVTHVSINGLQGAYLSTLITVGTNGTALPSNQMVNRRSLIIYNGSGSTVYIGGAGVTASGSNQGFPVLANTSSPSFDAGQNMILYGVVSTGTANVNVLEMSEENSGR